MDRFSEWLPKGALVETTAKVFDRLGAIPELAGKLADETREILTPPKGVVEVPMPVLVQASRCFLKGDHKRGTEIIMEWDKENNPFDPENPSQPGYRVYRLGRMPGKVKKQWVGQDILLSTDPQFNHAALLNQNGTFGRDEDLLRSVTGDSVATASPTGEAWRRRRTSIDMALLAQRQRPVYDQAIIEALLDPGWQDRFKKGDIIFPFQAYKELALDVIARLSISDVSSNEALNYKKMMQEAFPPIEEGSVRHLVIDAMLGKSPLAKEVLFRLLPDLGKSERIYSKALDTMKKAIQWTLAQEEERIRHGKPSGNYLTTLFDDLEYPTPEGKKRTRLSPEEREGQVQVSFIAGVATTATTAAWSRFLLAQRPDKQDQLFTELNQIIRTYGGLEGLLKKTKAKEKLFNISDYPVLHGVLVETLRLYPPVFWMFRQAEKADKIAGYEVRPHSVVIMDSQQPHLAEHIFEDPQAYKPERFPKRPSAGSLQANALQFFGGGPTHCAGFGLAYDELTFTMLLEAQLGRRLVPNPYDSKLPPRSGSFTNIPEKREPSYSLLVK